MAHTAACLHLAQSVGNYWINIATLTGNNSPALLSYVGADARAAGSPKLSLGCDWARDTPGEGEGSWESSV